MNLDKLFAWSWAWCLCLRLPDDLRFYRIGYVGLKPKLCMNRGLQHGDRPDSSKKSQTTQLPKLH